MTAPATTDHFELMDGQRRKAVIRVMGIGGGGCNTVNQMAQAAIQDVEFICANTDRDHLERCVPTSQLQMGAEITRGLGAGSDPARGREAAEEDRERIREMLDGTDLLFITAGMGGGTGTGAAPVVAEIAKEMGILTVAVVTKPFTHEGKKRTNVAMKGVEDLRQHVDSLILIPNEKLRLVLGGKATVQQGFKAANDVLQNAVQGISDLITCPGLINVDFADVRTVMSNRGMAMMGLGFATGEDRAQRAVEMALSSPLLDDLELSGARGILVSISCDSTLTMDEQQYINEKINEIASDEADMKCGASINPDLNGELRVTVVATGLNGSKATVQVAPALAGNPRVTVLSRPDLMMTAQQQPVQRQQAELDRPAYIRSSSSRQVAAAGGASHFLAEYDEEIINIPAFLRNQAD
ncbi:MAG: cell division protein FtsZ [Stenotrophobium sp.]